MNFEERYLKLVQDAEIIKQTAVKGCNVLLPYGYSIWEMIKAFISGRLKELGYMDMYFPSYIPMKFFKKEEEHFKSFDREVLKVNDMVIRPTSETIIYPSIKDSIKDKFKQSKKLFFMGYLSLCGFHHLPQPLRRIRECTS